MNSPNTLGDATDLAQLLGDTETITQLLSVVALNSTQKVPLSAETVVNQSSSVNRELADLFFQFLLSRGYATRGETPEVIEINGEDCINLLSDCRRSINVLDYVDKRTEQVAIDFVCTLPENDPGFSDLDPVDFGMRQITTRLLTLCRNASDELVLTSPFLEVEGMDWLLPGLEGALERGVDLTLVSRQLQPGQPNHTAVQRLFEIAEGHDGQLAVYDYYEPEEDGKHPKYTLHSKILIADQRTAYVGSANFTKYGFSQNLEIGVVIQAPAVESLNSVVAHVVGDTATLVTPGTE